MNELAFGHFMELAEIWWELTPPGVGLNELMEIDLVELFQDCYE